ncbi:MAG: hypothetical protein GY934_09650, partial [Gammaproteobacteria bacterium]|nr:hypothetical protein [Gammaproteobacteria bacterium]
GQRTIYHYELLIGGSEINGEGRKALLASLQQAKAAPNWKGLSKQWKSEGHNISYRQAKGTLDVLDVKLANLLQGLKPNETSNVVFQDGAPTIVRLNQKQILPARPLAQVSAEIRKSLVPVQLKKQIEKISTEITKTTKVEYLN